MKSIIYSISKEELQTIVNNSKTYGQILKHFGLENRGNNHRTLKKRLVDEDIDFSHIGKFAFGGGWNKGMKFKNLRCKSKDDALKEIFIDNYPHPSLARNYVKRYNLIQEKCIECGLENIWNNKPITLELDHKDGNPKNNKLSNLRWVCPNCHSQTPNFRGRKRRIKYFCKCGKEIYRGSEKCRECSSRSQPRIIKDRPSKEKLFDLIKSKSFLQIGKDYNVSDNSIRKWCKFYGLPYRKKDLVGPLGTTPSSAA